MAAKPSATRAERVVTKGGAVLVLAVLWYCLGHPLMSVHHLGYDDLLWAAVLLWVVLRIRRVVRGKPKTAQAIAVLIAILLAIGVLVWREHTFSSFGWKLASWVGPLERRQRFLPVLTRGRSLGTKGDVLRRLGKPDAERSHPFHRLGKPDVEGSPPSHPCCPEHREWQYELGEEWSFSGFAGGHWFDIWMNELVGFPINGSVVEHWLVILIDAEGKAWFDRIKEK